MGWSEDVVVDGKVVGVMCGRGGRSPGPCQHPGCKKQHTVLCDWPVKKRRARPFPQPGHVIVDSTCSKRCCKEHSKHVGKDKDYCLEHAELHEHRAPELPGLK